MVQIAGGRAAWRGSTLAGQDDWKVELSAADRAEMLTALAAVDRPGVDLRDIARDDFALPGLSDRLAAAVDELVTGRGFVLFRGLPVEGLTERQAELLYWGLSRHLGIPMRQKNADDLLVHVRNDGDPRDPLVWGVETAGGLDYHSDSSDVVGLLCIRPARSGGVSTIVSAGAVHDEIVRRRPDLAEVLHGPCWHDRRLGDGPENFFQCPIFALNPDGDLFAHYGRAYIESAVRGAQVPPLSAAQVEAMDLLDELTNDREFVLDMEFAVGDAQFLNNYKVMHARTAYVDHPERDRRRDLVRVWLVLERDLELPPAFESGGIIARSAALGG